MLLLTIYIGSTLHSLLSLPFSGANFKNQTNQNTYANNEKIRLRFLTVYFLIIDEISLLTCWFLCQIHKILQRAKGNDLPFGGIEILFSGDFNQFPPINGAGLFINSNKLLDFVISKIQNAKKKPHNHFKMPLLVNSYG
jgi:ATP-dependent DNA helicase PIF1